MDAGKHTHIHIKTELKDYIRLNKSESFSDFIIKHALSFLKLKAFCMCRSANPIQNTFLFRGVYERYKKALPKKEEFGDSFKRGFSSL